MINVKFKPAFTVIEILVSITIISVLATLVMVISQNFRANAHDSQRISDIHKMQDALERYGTDEGVYPDYLTPGNSLVGPTSGKTYLEKIPTNPTPWVEGACTTGMDYTYATTGHQTYTISFCLATGANGGLAGYKQAFPGVVATAYAPCWPSCVGKTCGDNGCGGSCGSCTAPQTCVSGSCACTPDCTGKTCGDDGCGGSCGSCVAPQTCVSGNCACVPDCTGKNCGDDGCGGSCGSCVAPQTCAGGGVAGVCGCTASCTGKCIGDSDGCGGACTSDSCSWQVVGSAGFSAAATNYNCIAFNPSTSQPYVSYQDASVSNKVTVKYYNGSSWTNLGSSVGLSARGLGNTNAVKTLVFDSSTNLPYVVFRDVSSPYKAIVYYWTGATWTTLGSSGGFSAAEADYSSIAFNPSTHLPFVAYRDAVTNKVTSMSWTGAAWANVGSASFSAGSSWTTSIAFNPATNQPYVIYRDDGNGGKATVMYYNGSAWANVGTAGFSAGAVWYTDIAFNPSTNQPYVTFYDASLGNKAIVMYYNGSAWTNVGSATGITTGEADYTTLVFHPTTYTLYLGYADAANGGKATVKYWDGANWNNLGTAGFSAGQTWANTMAINPTTTKLYMGYRDASVTNKATVMYYSP